MQIQELQQCVVAVQSLNCVQLFVSPWRATHPSFTIFQCLLKFMSIESVMLSNHLILCLLLLLLPSIFPSLRVFAVSQLFLSGSQRIRVSTSVGPMNIQDWFPLELADFISLKFKGLSRVFSSNTIGKHQFFVTQPSYGPTLTSTHDYWKNHNFNYRNQDTNYSSGLLTM